MEGEKKIYREESRKEYYKTGPIDRDDLNTGSLMRIADSLEKMEKPFNDLINNVKYYKELAEIRFKEIEKLQYQNAGYKAWITRLKNKINKEKERRK